MVDTCGRDLRSDPGSPPTPSSERFSKMLKRCCRARALARARPPLDAASNREFDWTSIGEKGWPRTGPEQGSAWTFGPLRTQISTRLDASGAFSCREPGSFGLELIGAAPPQKVRDASRRNPNAPRCPRSLARSRSSRPCAREDLRSFLGGGPLGIVAVHAASDAGPIGSFRKKVAHIAASIAAKAA